MKKRILQYMTILAMLLVIGCQNDGLEEGTEVSPAIQSEMIEGEIQYASKEIIQKLLDQIPDAMSRDEVPPIDFDGDTFGCVTIVDGIVYINDECESITSGPPEKFDDCDIVARGLVDCGVWDLRPDCIICVWWFVAECDGKLQWDYGYTITCLYQYEADPIPIQQ